MNPRIKLDRQTIIRLLDGYPVQVATEVGLLEFEAESSEWQPMWKLNPTPPHMVRAHVAQGLPGNIEVWRNETYEVIVTPANDDGLKHLSIKRYDRMPTHNWRHLQQMKNEICGEEWEAIELYPDESRLADNANQTHLWAVPSIEEGMPKLRELAEQEGRGANRQLQSQLDKAMLLIPVA